MDRWVSRSSSGRRTPARSRCSWSAISPCSSAIRGSSSRTGSTSIASSATSIDGGGALLAGTIGTFDDLFEHVADGDRATRPVVASDAQRALALRRAVASRDDARRSGRVGGRSRGSRTRSLGDARRARVRRSSSPTSSTATSRSSSRAYRDELERLGFWDRDGLRRHAVERLAGDLDAWGGAPVFAYGFEDLTGAEWALLEALAARTEVTVSIPYEPGRARPSRRSSGRSTISPALAGGAIEELPPAADATRCRRRSLHLERELFAVRRRGARRRRSTARSASSRAPGTRGTVELLAERDPRAPPRRRRAGARSRVVCESVDRWRAPLETAFARSGSRYAVEHARAARPRRRSARRCSRCSATPGSAASRGELFAFLRSPFSGLERRSGRLRRGPPARPRGRGPRAGRGGEREAARRAAAALAELARGAPGRRGARARARDGAQRLGARGAADDRRRALDARAYAAPSARSTSSRRSRERGRRSRRGRARRRARAHAVRPDGAAGEAGPRRRARPRARAHAAGSTSCSCSGSRRVRSRAARARRRSSTSDDSAARARRRASSGRTPSRATATSSTRPARAPTRRLYLVREAASDEGEPARAEPVLGGRPNSLRPGGRAARDPSTAAVGSHVAARVGAERARAPARARRARSRRRRRRRCARGRERLVASARSRARRLRPRPTRAAPPGRARAARGEDDVLGDRARALRRLLLRVARRARDRPEDDRRRADDPMLRGQVAAHDAEPLLRSAAEASSGAERVTPENLEAALALVRRSLDDALESGVRLDLTELQAARARQALRARPRGASSGTRPRPRSPSSRAGSRSPSAPTARLPSCSVACRSGRTSGSRGRSTGSTSTRSARGGSSRTTSRARAPIRRETSTGSCASRSRCTSSRFATSSASSRWVACTARSPAKRLARGMLREESARGPARVRADDYLDEDDVLGAGRARARERAADSRERIRAGDVRHDPEGRRLPGVVRPLADLPGAARVTVDGDAARAQRRAAGRRRGATGSVFVSAGAGTGKTSVLVERYVRAVCELGVDVESILVITYTRKAAGELRTRIRAALRERGRPDLARELDGAWISTIHGFCNRLLRAHPFAAGLDTRFRELEDSGAALLRGEAFERALEAFCATGDPERLQLLATYGAAGCGACSPASTRRCARPAASSSSSSGARRASTDAVDELPRGCDLASPTTRARRRRSAGRARASCASRNGSPPERLVDLSAFACKGARAASFERARKAAERAALEELAAHDRDLLQELLERLRRRVRGGEGPRVGA